ncbi:MAG TPA: YncE family protein [Nitrososphaeraceae archaeon]|nr:YncE family protein [Nitrososphaeraceae archaeon]
MLIVVLAVSSLAIIIIATSYWQLFRESVFKSFYLIVHYSKVIFNYLVIIKSWTFADGRPQQLITINYANAIDNSSSFVETDHSNQPGLTVDSYPIGVAVNPVTRKVYVTNEFSNTVSVINGVTVSKEDTITVGNFPYAVATNPFTNRVYVTNRGSDTVSIIDGSTNSKLHNVTVGNSPVGIAVNPTANWIYVTNINSGTVSVIDGITNKVTNTIAVNKAPYSIAVNPLTNKIYVTNIGSNTVSVIDGKDNKIVSNVTAGENPVGVAVNTLTNIIYVTNYASDTVSVIDGKDNKIIKNITVNPSLRGSYKIGDPVFSMPILVKFPLIASLVAINTVDNTVYVTNTGSDTVSVIDGNKDNVVVKIIFNVNPPNSGTIDCNNHQIPTNNYTMLSNGTKLTCYANPEHGFKFSSWSWSNFIYSDSNPIILNLTQYGSLTANFKEALSFEQYLAIILGPISVLTIMVGWLFRRRQRKYFSRYMNKIDNTFDRLHIMDKQLCLTHLDGTRREITQLFKRGTISDTYYNILDRRIADYIDKVNK